MGELSYSELLGSVIAGRNLSREQARWAFTQIMEGRWSESQVAGLLVGLAAKGETVEEIAGAAVAMREHGVKVVTSRADVIDTCGTGGTGLSTFNISTAASMVAAGAGACVAKHGNRTATRASGSADVLAALGVKIDATPAVMGKCLDEAGVGFCFAVTCHPAMKYAAPVRKSLGVRTLFNLLGPLTNPAGARRQLMGVFREVGTERVATVLGALGSVRAMVVHAEDGLDELSVASDTQVSELSDGKVTTWVVRPEDFGFSRATLADLHVGSAAESAAAIRAVLDGETGPRRDIVLLNASAALAVAGKASGLAEGIALAKSSLDSGAARAALEMLIRISNG